MTELLFALAGMAVGAVVAWLLAERRLAARANRSEQQAAVLEGQLAELTKQKAETAQDFEKLRDKLQSEQGLRVSAETRLAETAGRLAEERKLVEEAKTRLADTFKALASDTLEGSQAAFLKLARETFDKVLIEARGDLTTRQEAINGLVKPLSESLVRFDEQLRLIEKARQESYSGLVEQVKGLSAGQQQLQKETGNLVTALRRPEVRGRWGELTLQRVVEMAGLSEHCDFSQQVSVAVEEHRVRPDLIVHLPAGREVVVDSKCPLDAYLEAASAQDEPARKEAMERHARHVRTHMNGLADKRYWEQFPKAPEFVVMFIPGESFFSAALDSDRSLLEDALDKHVIMATPATLIALIRAIAYGWRQEQIACNAREISEQGRELYNRMGILAKYVAEIGDALDKATGSYNRAVGSLESRVLPTARRLKDLGAATGDEIPPLERADVQPRQISAPELLGGDGTG